MSSENVRTVIESIFGEDRVGPDVSVNYPSHEPEPQRKRRVLEPDDSPDCDYRPKPLAPPVEFIKPYDPSLNYRGSRE